VSDQKKPIIVIDTQLILRAAINERSLPARLIFEMGEEYVLAVSPGIRAEVKDVLNRPKLRRKFNKLTDEIVDRVLAVLDSGTQVTPLEIPEVSRDPKDDIFLATAVSAKAKIIVSEDNDLLVLNPYKDIRIVTALDFLELLEKINEVDDDKK